MDKDRLREFVVAHIDDFMSQLAISHWKVDVLFDLRGPDGNFVTKAECERRINYDRALINLNPGEIEGEDDARRVLMHELFHIVLAPFDLCRRAGEAHWTGDPAKAEVMEEIWHYSVEQAVICLERMYKKLTTPPKETAPMGRQKSRPADAPKATTKGKPKSAPKGTKPAK